MDGTTIVRGRAPRRQDESSDGVPARGVLRVGGVVFGTITIPGSEWVWLLLGGRWFGHVAPTLEGGYRLNVMESFRGRVTKDACVRILEAVTTAESLPNTGAAVAA
ncbi:MAG: hypothetical protein ACRD0P_27510 [Stackebrandtia sp.]